VRVLQEKTEISRVFQKNEMPHKQQRKKNTLGKVPSDYAEKIGAGLYEKQKELTLPIFRNAHQIFHIFLIIFNRYPWGISSEKRKKKNFSTQPPAITSSF
jgi:hypothetical protein